MDAMVKSTGRTLVLGLGNAMLSDLGAGIELIHRLRRRRPRPADVDLIRVGLVNVSLAQVIGEYAKLIVVEARPVGGEAGAVVEMQGARMDAFLRQQTGDAAALSDLLVLLEAEGRLPAQRALMLVQPGSARVGHGLSRPVTAALTELSERVLARAEAWNTPSRQTPGAALANFHLAETARS
jgi:hydrogenase maturation protease